MTSPKPPKIFPVAMKDNWMNSSTNSIFCSHVEYPDDIKDDYGKMDEYSSYMIQEWLNENARVKLALKKQFSSEESKDSTDHNQALKRWSKLKSHVLQSSSPKKNVSDGFVQTMNQSLAIHRSNMIASYKNQMSNQSLGRTNSSNNLKLNDILMARRGPVDFDEDDIIGKIIFGSDFKPSLPLYFILIFFFLIGMPPASLALFNFIPDIWIYTVITGYPYLIYTFLIMNKKLLYLLLQNSHVILFLIWNLIYTITVYSMIIKSSTNYSSGVILNGLTTFFTNTLASMIDALPIALRVVSIKLIIFSGIFVLIYLHVGLYFNWYEVKDIPLQFFGSIHTSTSNLASSALTNLTLYYLLYIAISAWSPHTLVMIIGRLEIVRMTEHNATLVKSMDIIRKGLRIIPDSINLLHIPSVFTSVFSRSSASSGSTSDSKGNNRGVVMGRGHGRRPPPNDKGDEEVQL